MTDVNLEVDHSLHQKFLNSWKNLVYAVPLITMLLIAWYAQTFFQTQTNFKSKAETVSKNYYVDAISGNDSNDGLTPSTAWKTLAKIRSYDSSPKFQPGDSILLKRGETWREQFKLNINGSNGIAGAPIVIDAYGTGAKPIISGGVDLSSPTVWVDQGNNVWKTSNLPTEVAQLVFNNDQSSGYMKLSSSDLASSPKQGDFYYDIAGQFVEMYSVGNPGTFYTHIEGAQRYSTLGGDGTNMIGGNRQYLTIRNIQFRYAAAHGLQVGDNSSHVTIEDCDFAFIGGAHDSVDKQGAGYRDFNGIMPTQSQSYLIIRNNTFHDIWEQALSFQSWSSVQYTWDHIYVYNNLFYHTNKSAIELWDGGCSDPMSTISNFYIYNNTAYDIGDSIYSHELNSNDGTPAPRGLKINGLCANMSNIVVKNNIFSTVQSWLVYAYQQDLSNWDIDNNLYYPDGTNKFVTNDGSGYDFAKWKSVTGKDAHSIIVDPKFANASAGDFSLQTGSPAIGAGVIIPDVAQNFSGTAPDIGAVESGASAIVPTSGLLPTATSTPVPTAAAMPVTPTNTPTPIIRPTATPMPSSTNTPTPTPRPTATLTPRPTNIPTPSSVPTSIPAPKPTLSPTPVAVSSVLEAETAAYSGPLYNNNYSGYTGSGFVAFQHQSNDYIQWTVNVPSAGKYNLSFRYANGSWSWWWWWANRPLQVKINGAVVNPWLSFYPTGGWSNWGNSNQTANLNAGTNTITLTAIGNGGPNIDNLKITAK